MSLEPEWVAERARLRSLGILDPQPPTPSLRQRLIGLGLLTPTVRPMTPLEVEWRTLDAWLEERPCMRLDDKARAVESRMKFWREQEHYQRKQSALAEDPS